MRRIVVILSSLAVSLVVLAGTAFADAGPHGSFTPTSDACAGCHRTHTAVGASLLKSAAGVDDKSAFCYTCHGTSGQGADTNVQDGVYQTGRQDPYGDGMGISGAPLKGGGFSQAMMSSAISNTASITTTTSSHTVNGAAGTLWGSGGISTTVFAGEANFKLTCTNCHDPHGNGNYRILRAQPTGSAAAVDVKVGDEPAKNYTVSGSGVYNYFGVSYASATTLSSWCSQCHDRYYAVDGSGHNDSGDALFHFRHNSNGEAANCSSCHVAHGSSASTGGNGAMVNWPNDGARGDDSSLLRLDNRGVCVQCHVSNGKVTGGSCNSCHGPGGSRPINTNGMHNKHVSTNPSFAYGNTANGSNATSYVYGCGTCHPLDSTNHMDGLPADIELSNAAAPSGSLKALNTASNATYSAGTCSNMYCHSAGRATLNTYASPSWTSGTTTCTSCHNVPASGTGRHSRHVTTEGFACSTCHSATVSGNTTIINESNHVDGLPPDVVILYGSTSGTWNSGTRTCNTPNGACHGTSKGAW